MTTTTCLILCTPGAITTGEDVDGLDDELVFDGPLDEHPIAATATTTATTPHRIRHKRIQSTLRATPTANDATAPTARQLSADCEPTEVLDAEPGVQS
jgi:hypothetical protein